MDSMAYPLNSEQGGTSLHSYQGHWVMEHVTLQPSQAKK